MDTGHGDRYPMKLQRMEHGWQRLNRRLLTVAHPGIRARMEQQMAVLLSRIQAAREVSRG